MYLNIFTGGRVVGRGEEEAMGGGVQRPDLQTAQTETQRTVIMSLQPCHALFPLRNTVESVKPRPYAD